MVVLVLWACLAGQPASCSSVNLPGQLPSDQCLAFAPSEVQAFEARHPGVRVRRTWCLRLGGQEV